ncbi:MAG: outer membrane beta-barrel protein [Oceanospirillaceae bacterium]
MNRKLITSSLIPSLLLTALVMTTSAKAEGVYIFGNVNSSSVEHSIERNLGSNPAAISGDSGGVSNVQDTAFAAGLGIGYKIDLNEDLYIAAEGFYEKNNNSSRNINGVLVTDINLESSYGVRLLAGVNVNKKFSVYAHGGYTELDFDIRNSYTFAPPVKTRSESKGAFAYGVGADYKVNGNYSLYAQYSQIADIDFDGIPEVAGGTGRINPNKLDLSQLTIGLRYAF